MTIFAARLSQQRHHLSKIAFLGKFAGATGNYNAHLVAYPELIWARVAEEFVTALELSFNPFSDDIFFLLSLIYSGLVLVQNITCAVFIFTNFASFDLFYL